MEHPDFGIGAFVVKHAVVEDDFQLLGGLVDFELAGGGGDVQRQRFLVGEFVELDALERAVLALVGDGDDRVFVEDLPAGFEERQRLVDRLDGQQLAGLAQQGRTDLDLQIETQRGQSHREQQYR